MRRAFSYFGIMDLDDSEKHLYIKDLQGGIAKIMQARRKHKAALSYLRNIGANQAQARSKQMHSQCKRGTPEIKLNAREIVAQLNTHGPTHNP